MTPQQIFDLALTRVLEQGKPAYDDNTGCQYYKSDGSRCAVGLLLPLELAKEWTANDVGSVDDLMFYLEDDPESVTFEVPSWIMDHNELLESIQAAHDTSATNPLGNGDLTEWREDFISRMKWVAQTFNLKFPELERTEPEHT